MASARGFVVQKIGVGVCCATGARPTSLRSPLEIEIRMASGVEQQLPDWAMHRDIPDDHRIQQAPCYS